jgi:hypothetical protein
MGISIKNVCNFLFVNTGLNQQKSSCSMFGSTANLVENKEYLKLKIYVILIIRFNIL